MINTKKDHCTSNLAPGRNVLQVYTKVWYPNGHDSDDVRVTHLYTSIQRLAR